MSPARFAPLIPTSELPQSLASDNSNTGISTTFFRKSFAELHSTLLQILVSSIIPYIWYVLRRKLGNNHFHQNSCIHYFVCLTTDPYTLPQQVLHRVQFSSSAFKFHYPLVSLKLSSSCLRFLIFLTRHFYPFFQSFLQ